MPTAIATEKRQKSLKAKKRELYREAVLDAAERVFGDEGYEVQTESDGKAGLKRQSAPLRRTLKKPQPGSARRMSSIAAGAISRRVSAWRNSR